MLPYNLTKGRIFFHTLLFCGKADFRSANLTSKVIFFDDIVRVASSTNACELTVESSLFQNYKVFTFHETFLISVFWSEVKREISQGPKCTSQIWKSAVIGLSFFLAQISRRQWGRNEWRTHKNVCLEAMRYSYHSRTWRWDWSVSPLLEFRYSKGEPSDSKVLLAEICLFILKSKKLSSKQDQAG